MEEIRIKIHDELPYYDVLETIEELLSNEIGEEDRKAAYTCPKDDYTIGVCYKKGKTKLFEVWKIQSKTTES